MGDADTGQQANVDVAFNCPISNGTAMEEWGQALKGADTANWMKMDDAERAQHVAWEYRRYIRAALECHGLIRCFH